ncbi:helix-turn-helix domain-containing protein [Catalinimonas locisalis]|uniref:helix-turn-helix domain-containing protein n=1 Tax=Catalinimonas locisalis TaxID=3133978 RepID=UPI0031018AA5
MSKANFLKTQHEYNQALALVYELMHADIDVDSPEAEELDQLTSAIGTFEAEHYPVEEQTDPVEIIKFRMEQMNLKQKDVAPIFGGVTRVSEYLNKKRPLTMKIIYNLHKYLDIPYDLLIEERDKYELPPQTQKKLQRLIHA